MIELPAISETRNNTIKRKNKIFAIPAAPAAIPVNPNSAATIATTKNIRVQRNMISILIGYVWVNPKGVPKFLVGLKHCLSDFFEFHQNDAIVKL